MDEGGSLTTEFDTTKKSGCNESVEKASAATKISPLISDENENRIREVQMSPCSNDRMGGFDWIKQDLINNNKEDHDKTGFEIMQSDCMEAVCDDEPEVSNSIDNLSAELPLGIKPVKNWEPEMERKLKITSSGTSVEATEDSSEFLSKSLSTIYDTSSESEVNCQQVDRKGLLQTLLNCIQGVTELNDSSSLPHYLHQIAEIYFDEEEYDKAIQFIQLEKLYHEKLLANLAAIQEHWEVKQKAAITRRETSEGRSVKALDNDKIVKLTEFCASHSRPNIPVNEISLLAERFYKNECHFPSKGGTCTKVTAECHSSFTDQPVAVSRVQSAKCDGASLEVTEDRRKNPTESVQTALTVDKVCEGVSAMYDAESLLEGEIEAARAKGMMHFDVETEHLYSENTVTDKSCFQQHTTAPCKDMLTAAKTIETEGFSKAEVVINTTPLFLAEETENLHRDLQFAGKTTEENAQTNLLECNKSIQFITDGQAVPKQSNHAFQKHVKSDPNDYINTEATSRQNTGHSEGSMRIDDQATQNQTDLLNEINECEQMSEKVGSKVEEEFQHSAEFNENLMALDISEKQEEDGNVEALCSSPWDVVSSSQKNDIDELAVQLNDSSHSLDELAKRIQIEENTHPEGLVSILKKSSNKEISRVQQKQSKRRVRFQEPQDTLDQDEDSGDSCLLLVLLCVITVLLSVGGTALYCTFGDLESSVCRDFTAQMNFYYAQFQQGIEKAKHWLLFS